MKVLTIVASTVLALSACAGGSQEPVEPVTVTESVPEYSEPAQAVPEEDIAAAAMELSWEHMGTVGQETICYGWEEDPEGMASAFLDEADPAVTEDMVWEFFDSKCGW